MPGTRTRRQRPPAPEAARGPRAGRRGGPRGRRPAPRSSRQARRWRRGHRAAGHGPARCRDAAGRRRARPGRARDGPRPARRSRPPAGRPAPRRPMPRPLRRRTGRGSSPRRRRPGGRRGHAPTTTGRRGRVAGSPRSTEPSTMRHQPVQAVLVGRRGPPAPGAIAGEHVGQPSHAGERVEELLAGDGIRGQTRHTGRRSAAGAVAQPGTRTRTPPSERSARQRSYPSRRPPPSRSVATYSAWASASPMPWPVVGCLKCPASPTSAQPGPAAER